jgi:hypothetical protein
VRPHVDEIVLAVDRAGDAATLDACAELADRRLSFELGEHSSRLYGWLRHQCASDWILLLDDDEVPSAGLLAALPELLGDRYIAYCDLKRRWLFPTPDRYIVSQPWAVEFQARLLRNLPGLWRPNGGLHRIFGEDSGDRRLLDLPIYHCDLVLRPPQARRRKSQFYETLRPGLEYGAFPLNAMYIPEAFDGIETAAVPDEDQRLIHGVLDHVIPPSTPPRTGPVESFSAADIDRFAARQELSASAYRASVSLVGLPRRLPPATLCHYEALVHNRGDERWPSGEGSEPLILVGFRWRERASGRVVLDGRARFTEVVKPGQTARVLVETVTPRDPGEHVLELDLVHEHLRWFGCDWRAPVCIVDPDEEPLLRWPRIRQSYLQQQLGSDIHRLRAGLHASRSQAADAHARANAIEGFMRTRRYRVAATLARSLDFIRRLTRRAP